MTIKSRKQLRLRADDRMLIHAGLFVVCAVLSALGPGALALWSFVLAAVLVELLAALAPAPRKRWV